MYGETLYTSDVRDKTRRKETNPLSNYHEYRNKTYDETKENVRSQDHLARGQN